MKRWFALSGLLVIVLGFLLYARTLNAEFVELDDPLLILENPAAQSLSWTNVKTVFSSYDPELYIPLTFVSYQIDATVGGLNPFVFHLHNLLEHILNAILFLLAAYQLTGKKPVALFAALLFLVHPVHVEAVLWASGRKDLLSTTFFLLSVLLYLRFRTRKDWISYPGSILSFLLGLLSKVTVISLPLVLFLLDWLDGRKLTIRSVLEKIPYLILSVLFGIVALYGKTNAPDLPILTRVLVAAKSLVFSFGKILFPAGLSPMYAYAGPITPSSPAFLIPLLCVLIVIAAAFYFRRRWTAFACAVAFVLLTFAPSFANLVKNGDYYLTADRYSYIPSLGIFLLAALGLERAGQWFSARTSSANAGKVVERIAVALLLVLTVVAFKQTAVWSDTETLSRYVTEVSPDARLGHLWYGNALRDAGKIDEALAQYETALAFHDDPQVYYNRALALEMKGSMGQAMVEYQKAIALLPGYALAHINLGRLYYQQGKPADARKEFEAAASAAPTLAMPLFNLGVLEGEQKRFGTAAEFYRKALERDPTLSDARANLVVALLALGKTAEAVEELKATLLQDPENPTANATLQELIRAGIVKTGS